MPDWKDESTRTGTDTQRERTPISRRRLLQLTGAGIVGGVFATGNAAGADTDLSHTIVFSKSNATSQAEYSFSVSGSVKPHGDVGALEASDTIDGTSVTGVLQDDTDAYRFSGQLTSLDVSGAVSISLNYSDVSDDDSGPDRLEIVTPTDGSVEYSFTADGEITKVLDNGNNSAEPNNDTVTQNGDGTWTAAGLTGNGYGDAYDIAGSVTSFDATTETYSLFLNGTETTVTELTGQDGDSGSDTDDGADDTTTQTRTLEIVTPTDGSVEYTLTTSGEIRKVLDNGDNSAEPNNDTVSQNSDGTWTADGLTGNGYGDTFAFDGDALDFTPREGTFALYLDGQQISAYELVGEEKPDDSDDSGSGGGSNETAIGGGRGYANTVGRDQADYLARSRGELRDAISSASAGEVVYVPGNAEIDIGDGDLDVGPDVTLASNRGIDDAPGALLETSQEPGYCLAADDGSRITGIRLKGPHPGGDRGGSSGASGIETVGEAEIDNCDIWGFSYAGVDVDAGGDAHSHHNVIREDNKGGLGDGVSCTSGDPVIEYNYFNYNRHSVASSGDHYGYTCRYNHFGPEIVKYTIGAHEPAGTRFEVHNNVVEGYRAGGETYPCVAVRGTPGEEYRIRDNWLFNPNEPGSEPDGWSSTAIIQPLNDSWDNVSFSGNSYGPGASVSVSDIIPGYDGWRS